MQITFYSLGDTQSSLKVTLPGIESVWEQMCELIVEHVLGHDPYSEADASDIVEVVAMESTDGDEYVEAVYVKGELVGSIDAPFWYPFNEYVKI